MHYEWVSLMEKMFIATSRSFAKLTEPPPPAATYNIVGQDQFEQVTYLFLIPHKNALLKDMASFICTKHYTKLRIIAQFKIVTKNYNVNIKIISIHKYHILFRFIKSTT